MDDVCMTAASRDARRRWAHFAGGVLLTASLVGMAVAFTPTPSGAAEPHSGCAAVSAGGNSGWCGLYPGDATSNVQDLGSVAVSSDGSTITVQTESVSTGMAPETSFACLVSTPASQITKRLQDRHCTSANGIWLPFDGGSLSINLNQYPQFANATFTIQVAANANAHNANGDAFYNNFSVSTVVASGPPV